MFSTHRIVQNLTNFAHTYTSDLAQPFEENVEENEMAETPLLIISDICKCLGLSEEQTYAVLGHSGTEFVLYLENCTFIEINQATETANLFGLRIPIAGAVGDGGKVTLNAYGSALFE